MTEVNMKKIVIEIVVLVVVIIMMFFSFVKINNKRIEKEKIKNPKIEITLTDNMTLEFLEKKKVSDYIRFINGEIVEDYQINSKKLGTQTVEFKYINEDGVTVEYSYDIEVVDTKAPLAFVKNTYYIKKGGSKNFYKKIFCGDNYDSNPKCYIEGDYDVNKVCDHILQTLKSGVKV